LSTAQSNVYIYNKTACENVKSVVITCTDDTIWGGTDPDTSEHFSLPNDEIEIVRLISVESASNNQNIFVDPDLLYKPNGLCGYPFFQEPGSPSCIQNYDYVEEIDNNGYTNLFISIW